MHSYNVFTHNMQNSLLLLIHVQVQCDLTITWNTCVNVCSLNCLNLFLKYKIGQTCLVCVCVCVFWIMNALHFFLLRDGFESLTCRLNPCLSSLLVAFIFMCFSSLKNLFSSSSIASRQILNRFTSIKPLFLLVSIEVSVISIHRDFQIGRAHV